MEFKSIIISVRSNHRMTWVPSDSSILSPTHLLKVTKMTECDRFLG